MDDLIKLGALYASETAEWINKDVSNPSRNLKIKDGYNVLAELESAILKIGETTNLSVCSKSSVMSALRDMVIQGLSVTKNQCYFIQRGNKLTLMRSYFGTISVLKEAMPGTEVYANVIYEGDSYSLSVDRRGFTCVSDHTTTLESRKTPIIAAYCNLVNSETGDVFYTEVMSIDEIKTCWGRSANRNLSVHKDFTGEMAKRTVINRAVKHFLNTSGNGDSNILGAYQRSLDSEFEDTSNTANKVNGRSEGRKGLEELLQLSIAPVQDEDGTGPTEEEEINESE